MVVSSSEEKERVLSQLKRIIRALYSSPPIQWVSVQQGDQEVMELTGNGFQWSTVGRYHFRYTRALRTLVRSFLFRAASLYLGKVPS